MIFTLAVEQEYDKLNLQLKHFRTHHINQYSSIPIVVALMGLLLEVVVVHYMQMVNAAETYGTCRIGVGLIPGGGGTKEMALRASDAFSMEY